MPQAVAEAQRSGEAFQLRLLEPGESALAYDVHVAVRRCLPHASFMYNHGRGFFRDIASSAGRLVGAWSGGQLVGYAALRLAQGAEATHWRHLGHLLVRQNETAEGAGGAVLPAFRNLGVFASLVRKRNEVARELGMKFQTSLVAPGNVACLRPLLEEDFIVAAPYVDKDGVNYLMLHSLAEWVPFEGPECGLSAALDDAATHIQLLRSGRCGLPSSRGSTLRVSYRRPSRPPCGCREVYAAQ